MIHSGATGPDETEPVVAVTEAGETPAVCATVFFTRSFAALPAVPIGSLLVMVVISS